MTWTKLIVEYSLNWQQMSTKFYKIFLSTLEKQNLLSFVQLKNFLFIKNVEKNLN